MPRPTDGLFHMPIRRMLALALAVALTSVPPLASPALAAGTLTVWGGSLPDATAVPAGPWTGVNYGAAAGGVFGLWMPPGAALGWSQTASLGAPSGLAFASVTAQRSFATPTSGDTAQAQILTTWENRGWPYNGVSEYGGYLPASGSGAASVSNPANLSINVNCTAFGVWGGSCTSGAYWLVSQIVYTLADAGSPTGSLVDGGGELLDGAWQTARTVELTLAGGDGESGLYRAFVRDGSATYYTSLVPADVRCRDARPGQGSDYEFTAAPSTLVPCPRATDAYTPAVDLAAIGDGIHADIEIGIEDASGREKILATGRTLKINAPGGSLPDPGTAGPGGCVYAVDGVCIAPAPSGGGGATPTAPPAVREPDRSLAPFAAATPPVSIDPEACNGQPCPDAPVLKAAFDRSASDTLRVTYGASAAITGRLTDRNGRPIADAILAMAPIQTANGDTPAREIVTRADGGFNLALPATATSQIIRIAYRGHPGDGATEATATAALELKVRAYATLTVTNRRRRGRVARNGDTVVFAGRVDGRIPVGGKTVYLQANAGHGWTQFGPNKTLKTDSRGAFAYRYRISKTWGRVTYRFRAFVPAPDGGANAQFPFEDGYSKITALTVHGYPVTAAQR